MARDSDETIGWVTRLLHWTMAVGIVAAVALGSYIVRMDVSLANLWLFGVHKSLGLVLLAMAFVRIAWHRQSPPPAPLDDGVAWHGWLARAVHSSLYVLMLAVPLTGWVGSAASGLDVVVFDTWTLPRIAPVSERLEDLAFALHWGLTRALIALVLLHIAGAVHRRDGTLRRMLWHRAVPPGGGRQ